MGARQPPAQLSAAERARAVRRALLVTWFLNLAVAGSKIAYGTLNHALSIRADGFHSLTDSANNLIGLLGITIASRPADPGHPYGHHKFEILAAGVVGISLLAMALRGRGLDARSFTGRQVGIITDNAHTKARISRVVADRIRDALE